MELIERLRADGKNWEHSLSNEAAHQLELQARENDQLRGALKAIADCESDKKCALCQSSARLALGA